MNEPAYDKLAKDLPPVVNDDRPDLQAYADLRGRPLDRADKAPMDDAMKQIEEATNG